VSPVISLMNLPGMVLPLVSEMVSRLPDRLAGWVDCQGDW